MVLFSPGLIPNILLAASYAANDTDVVIGVVYNGDLTPLYNAIAYHYSLFYGLEREKSILLHF